MPTRNGKVANLPNGIREQLNLRLLEGETGRELAAWLNALPEAQSILGSQFNGSPISEVNLTHWRQGGYLQWLTQRECFHSARALADGDCDLAKAGLFAERLLNILTLRYGELLMRWDLSPNGGVYETAAFSEVARKARILQGISRSVLAIHRIQSQSTSSKTERARSSFDSPPKSSAPISPPPSSAEASGEVLAAGVETTEPSGKMPMEGAEKAKIKPALSVAPPRPFRALCGRVGVRPEILSGPISPSSVPSNLSQLPFEADPDLAEVLDAV